MIEVQQCCAPAPCDFELPLDFMVDDDALELARLSESIFSDTPFSFLVDDSPSVQPLRSASNGSSGSEGGCDAGATLQQMVPLQTLQGAAGHQCATSGGSASPASSGEASYKPVSDGGSDGSDFTESRHPVTPRHKATATSAAGGTAVKVDPRIGKRKADVDLDTISDIQERRKQRRLAKNRATAATSRARKREQMSHLSVRVAALEAENAALQRVLTARTRELANATAARPL